MSHAYGLVGFDELVIDCIIGDLPREREVIQSIIIDLRVEVDFTAAAINDDLNQTIDYTRLADLCTELAQHGQYRLLERYVDAVSDRIIEDFNIKSVWIKIRKPSAIKGAKGAVVELKKVNKKYVG